MSIPLYTDIFIPLLNLYSDNQIHHKYDFNLKIYEHFNVSEAEQNLKLKSGNSTVENRISWATTFLFKAKLITRTSRSNYKITERGIEFLKLKWTEYDFNRLYEIYPDLLEDLFWNPKLRNTDSDASLNVIEENTEDYTPDELLDQVVKKNQSGIYSDLKDQIKNITPRAFEKLVVDLLVKMNYGTEEFSRTTSYTNDKGIDGIVQADILGFEKIYVQAKKYEGKVGRPDIQHFLGSLQGNKGIFITTSSYSNSVYECVRDSKLVVQLIDGQKLIELMYKFNQGVSVKTTVEVKGIDTDYFEGLE